MASGNSVEINVNANVTGSDDVGKLGADLGALGGKAGAAGQGAAAAAVGIDRLGAGARQAGLGSEAAAKGINATTQAAAQAPGAYSKTRQGLESVSQQLERTQQGMAQLRDLLISGWSTQQFVQAAADMEKMQAGLQAVSGDAALAKEQMDFVRQMATRAGVDVVAAGQAFLGLAAATKGTAVEGEPARQVFEALTTAMAKAGKSSADTQNALLALSQMASKGTVSMEELRGQLGEALPGALQAAANGLGITTQDLIKLVESGQIATEDLFPALSKGLNELYGSAPAAQTLSQEITNVKNAFVEMAANLGEAGALDALKLGAEAAQTAITFLGESFLVVGQQIGTLAAAVTTLDFSSIPAAMAEIEQASRERLLKAAEHNTVLAAALKQSGDAATLAALAVQESGAKAEASGTQAAAAAPGYTALGAAYAKVREELSGQLALADKELQATKARGEAAVAQAGLLGDEQALRTAIAQAAANEAAALEGLAQKRQTEVSVLVAELENKRALLAQGGEVTEAKQKELDALQALIAAKQLDADKALAQAAAGAAKAQANSEEVLAAQALTQQTEALKVARVADAQVVVSGLEAQKELARQAEQMARLMGNEAEARKAKILQLEIEIKITQAKTEVAKVEAQGTIAVAQAKLAEMKASGQLTPVKQAEIEASIKLAQAKVVEADAMGKSTTLLQKQIDALRSGTGHLDGFGNASGRAAGAQRGLAGSVDSATAALERQNAERERGIKAQEKANDLKARAKALEDAHYNRDSEGWTLNTAGQRAVGFNFNKAGALKEAKSQGLSEAEALRIARSFDPKRDGPSQLQERINSALLAQADRNVQKQQFDDLLTDAEKTGRLPLNLGGYAPDKQAALRDAAARSPMAAPTAAERQAKANTPVLPSGAPIPAKTYNVTINGTTVRTASDADAQTLLRVLQNAKLSA